jgi:hypothetical protein
LTAVIAAFGENVATNRDLATIMAAVATTMGQITRFVADIDAIGSEIKLIALNAIIKAAQAGKDGAGLNVIAETVKRQSEEICSHASAVTGAIVRIIDCVAEVQETLGTGDANAADDADAGALMAGLQGALDALGRLTADVFAQLAVADGKSATLAGQIDLALGGMSGDDMVAAIHDRIVPLLQDVGAAARREGAASGVGAGTKSLRSQEERYTMLSERRIHQAFVSSGGQGGLDGSLPHVFIPARGGDLGDNVELF